MRVLGIIIVLLCGLWLPQAQARPLITDISTTDVAITAGFSGASLVLFGMTDQPDGQLVIQVQGPRGTEIIRRKVNTFGLWLNREKMVFSNVPGYYDISSSAPLQDMLDDQALMQNGFGLDQLAFQPEMRKSMTEINRFNEALIQKKQLQGLFALGTHQIKHVGPQLFRSRISIPPNVPIGEYLVTTYLIRDQAVIAQDTQRLFVHQAGLTGMITNFAHHNALLYGLFAVLLAITAGWISNEIFRRD